MLKKVWNRTVVFGCPMALRDLLLVEHRGPREAPVLRFLGWETMGKKMASLHGSPSRIEVYLLWNGRRRARLLSIRRLRRCHRRLDRSSIGLRAARRLWRALI